jgi:hypothetical protein
MGDFRIIGQIGEQMKRILEKDAWEGMSTKPEIVFQSPKEIGDSGGTNKVSIFLFSTQENPFSKNQEVVPAEPGILQEPPLVLDLYYMITAYGSDATQEKYLLGKVMQIFHDHPAISDSDLPGSPAGKDPDVRLFLHPLSLDDLSKLWTSFHDVSLRLSVCYLATAVRIDSTREEVVQRVVEVDMDRYQMVHTREVG